MKPKFGRAFNDELEKVHFKHQHISNKKKGGSSWQDSLVFSIEDKFVSEEDKVLETSFINPWRRIILPLVILIAFSAILMRLFHLQIVEGKDNRELADSNRIQVKTIHAPRGVIYDRNGQILAQNEPGFRLTLASGSGKLVSRVARDEALKMEVEDDPRAKDLEVDSIRSYPHKEKTSHILGYVAEITEEELKDTEFKSYNLGDRIGRGGIEETFEKVLRGVDGGEVIEVDAQGKKIRTLRIVEPIPGQNVYLTIDVGLQEQAYKALEEGVKKGKSCCGAVVAQDPNNGQVLALVSYPGFDSTDLSTSLLNPNSPLLNRAIAGVYPPGSTFKIASALAGLESGKITAQTQFEDTGVINLGPYKFANWYFTQHGGKEGSVDLVKALKRSNDIYFYYLGQSLGEDILGEFAKKLGLGEKLGIDIPGEVTGLIPNNEWKEKNYDQSWYPGDTLHMAIGQGFVLATPLQINNLTAIVAADGKEYPPHLALKITTSKGRTIKDFKYEGSGVPFRAENIKLVQKGLEEVPKAGGTAWPFFTFPVATAGKTGTAEIGDAKGNTHAWYTSYGPLPNPSIVVTALVEAGGEGSTTTSPIVKEIERWYFSPDKNSLIKDINYQATDSAKILGE
jgi:penicillin-binding protein 2